MKFDISILAIAYKGKVLQAIGFHDSSDTHQLNFSDEVVEAIENDEATLAALEEKFMHFKRDFSSRYVQESEIYHHTGTFGNLKIYTTEVEIDGEQIKA